MFVSLISNGYVTHIGEILTGTTTLDQEIPGSHDNDVEFYTSHISKAGTLWSDAV